MDRFVIDFGLNKILFPEDLRKVISGYSDPPTIEHLEILRRGRMYIATAMRPHEVWFHWMFDKSGEIVYYHRYIAWFEGEDSDIGDVAITTAKLIRPGYFEVIDCVFFDSNILDNNRWRNGILIYYSDLSGRKEWSNENTGELWIKSVEKGLHNENMIIVRDVTGAEQYFQKFKWIIEDHEKHQKFMRTYKILNNKSS